MGNKRFNRLLCSLVRGALSIVSMVGIFLLLCVVCFAEGCAYSYIDNDGDRHLIGLVDVKIRDAPESETYAGQIVDWRTLGISVNRNEMGSSVAIGYNRDVSGYLKNNSLVIGNPFEFPNNAMNGRRRE